MKRSGYSIGLLPAKKTKSKYKFVYTISRNFHSQTLNYSTFCFLVPGLYDVNEHLERLRDIWPRVVFEDKLPPVVMKHQLYSLHSDRTEIDSEVVSTDLL